MSTSTPEGAAQGNGEIIALIPAYNEARFIADVVNGALKHLPVVVVDDGSSDGTGGAAALAGAKVISHGRNQGKGKALLTGFDYAIRRGVDAAITLDADGQHDPDEIPLFIEAFRAGQGDIIIGQRTVRPDAGQEPVRQPHRLLPPASCDGPTRARQPERLPAVQPAGDAARCGRPARASRPRWRCCCAPISPG